MRAVAHHLRLGHYFNTTFYLRIYDKSISLLKQLLGSWALNDPRPDVVYGENKQDCYSTGLTGALWEMQYKYTAVHCSTLQYSAAELETKWDKWEQSVYNKHHHFRKQNFFFIMFDRGDGCKMICEYETCWLMVLTSWCVQTSYLGVVTRIHFLCDGCDVLQ